MEVMVTTPHHHHHLRLAPLRVCSATGRQQPPQWLVLGQVDCVGPGQPVGVEVTTKSSLIFLILFFIVFLGILYTTVFAVLL